MSSYKDYKKRALQNPEVKAEYDALQPEYDIIQAMIDARVQQNMTQKDLSAKTGITQDLYDTGYCTEPLFIGRKVQKCLGTASVQECIEELLVTVDQRV